MSTFHYTGVFV